MKKVFVMLALAVSMAVSAAQVPSYVTGRALLNDLRSGNKDHRALAGLYLAGAFDATWAALHCAPQPDITSLVSAVLAELERMEKVDPAKLEELPAARFLIMPLFNRFPCPKAPGRTS